MRIRFLLLACILFLLAGCNLPRHIPLVTAAPDSTVTNTPFQPEIYYTPSATLPPWGNFPAPEATPATTQLPPPVGPIPQPVGQVNILLLGTDQGPGRSSANTDVIMLLTIKTNGSVSLTSFPRDLLVYIPGWKMQRLNTAYPHGGFATAAQTFEYNFGVRPNYYILTNFNGFRSIIDNLDGIDVNVARTLTDQRDGYPEPFTISAGVVHMDSDTALWYVRSRYSTSSHDRQRRALEVITAIGHKLIILNGLSHIPVLYNALHDAVDTNLTLEDVLRILPLLQTVDPNRVNDYSIGLDQVTPWTEPATGAYFDLPNPDAIHQVLQQALGTP